MAEKKGTPLSGVAGIPPEVTTKLSGFWITTAEELVSAAAQEGGLQGLVTLTGQTEAEMTRLVELAVAALPAGVPFGPGEKKPHGMGALDERQHEDWGRAAVPFAVLPPSIDFHDRLALVRNQEQRSTCVAFACTAVREYLVGPLVSSAANFSEQYLYWNCKQHDLIPFGKGTYVKTGMQQMETDGIPPEAAWPYNPNLINGNESQDPPPTGLPPLAAPNRITGYTQISPTNVDALRQELANGNPVAFTVPVFTYWFSEPTHSSGDVRLPLPGEKIEGGHAMCMVGYQTDPDVPGGGYFLVRNSWGPDWGSKSPVAPGHARIPFAFINEYGSSAYTARVTSNDVQPVGFFARLWDGLKHLFG